jgi:iron complex outermembrane receptor protein
LTARLFGNLSVSADYYHVAIDDRVVLSGLFSTDDGVLGAPISAVLGEFPGVGAAQFFVNAVDTTTDGVDVVLDYNLRLRNGVLKATAAANFTQTTVDAVRVPDSMKQRFAGVDGGEARVSELFLGRYGRNRLEDLLPRQKGTLGLRWDGDPWSVGWRLNVFGPTEYHSDTEIDGVFLDESFGADYTIDVDFGYRIGALYWSVGARNVGNNFPDEQKREDNRYNDSFLYSPASVPAGAPYGTDGAFYYVRAEYKF